MSSKEQTNTQFQGQSRLHDKNETKDKHYYIKDTQKTKDMYKSLDKGRVCLIEDNTKSISN